MEQIGAIIQTVRPSIEKRRSSTQLAAWQNSLSEKQRDNISKFKEKFPSVEKVYKYFSPSNLPHAIAHITECTTYPCVTLHQVDKVYGVEGIGKSIVRNLLTGVYSMSTTREQMPYEAADNAAGLFVAKYGAGCTLYALMVYFGNYLTEYKSSYAQFDVQDILQQYSKKFLPWWRMRIGLDEGNTRRKALSYPTGEEGLKMFIRNRLRNGDDPRNGYLYQSGQITDAMIDEQQQAMDIEVF